MSKESSRQDVSKTALFGIGTHMVVEQSSLESQSRGCAKTDTYSKHQIQPGRENKRADAGRDSRTCLVRTIYQEQKGAATSTFGFVC